MTPPDLSVPTGASRDEPCANCGHARHFHGMLQEKGSNWCMAPASGERAAPFRSVCNCTAFVSRASSPAGSPEPEPTKITKPPRQVLPHIPGAGYICHICELPHRIACSHGTIDGKPCPNAPAAAATLEGAVEQTRGPGLSNTITFPGAISAPPFVSRDEGKTWELTSAEREPEPSEDELRVWSTESITYNELTEARSARLARYALRLRQERDELQRDLNDASDECRALDSELASASSAALGPQMESRSKIEALLDATLEAYHAGSFIGYRNARTELLAAISAVASAPRGIEPAGRAPGMEEICELVRQLRQAEFEFGANVTPERSARCDELANRLLSAIEQQTGRDCECREEDASRADRERQCRHVGLFCASPEHRKAK